MNPIFLNLAISSAINNSVNNSLFMMHNKENKQREQLLFEFDIVVNAQRIHEDKFIAWNQRINDCHPSDEQWKEFYKNEHYVYLEKRRQELFKKMNEL